MLIDIPRIFARPMVLIGYLRLIWNEIFNM